MPEMTAELIAPCGMNCRLCIGFVRKRNKCAGCRSIPDANKAHLSTCVIRKCAELTGNQSGYCYECEKFPCRRMRQLDTRYKTKYHMSMLDNLAYIRDNGMPAFLGREEERWKCPSCGGVVSVHRAECPACGQVIFEQEM
jgi:hypothetical protein